jgi:ectoine hydroxylase-related dioxygenase (phytanoyl-CoA dioxygenase family)
MSEPKSLTEHDVETFWRDGVVCLRSVLPRDLLDSMAEPVDTALRSGQSADLTAMATSLTATDDTAVAGDDAARGRFVAGVDHWRHDPSLRAFAFDSPLPAIVASLLRSTEVFLYEDSVLVKEPHTSEPTVWHQDLGYFHVDGEQVCTTWCPLDPANAASGAMRFVRGSHRGGRLYRPNLFVTTTELDGTDGDTVPDIDGGDGFDIVAFDLEPGDVTVHHARTLHAAGPNRSSRRRRAISVRYAGDDARVRLRPGAPRKSHQAALTDGDRLGRDAHPRVWPVAPA